ncbi:MAG: methyltransferase domain-containing protein [Candidatus Bathyarchaeota archaeon]|nr:methyltransferase domain-containing protein [Candidatus Bathyarchaeota archaeon]
MAFEQDYFTGRKYSLKEELVKRHVLAVLRWASKNFKEELLVGKGRSALDVGCAYGYTSRVLADLGYDVFGVDISTWGTKYAKNLGGSHFVVCDAQTSMPFKAGTFDLVTCFDVLEHLPGPEKALVSMFNACKGILVCTTPNKKVEKPIRKLMRDYDETHISVKSPLQWQKCIKTNLECRALNVGVFYDLPLRFGGKLFFKSFNVPTYGLTVRIAVEK